MPETATRTFTKELLSLGLWTDNMGSMVDLREGDLEAIVQASPQDAPVKLGHTSDEFNSLVATHMGLPVEFVTGDEEGRGKIRLGCAGNFRVEADRILTDIELPDALADLVDQGMIVNVSAELRVATPYIITAVALLGAERPAIGNLRDFSEGGEIIVLSKQDGGKPMAGKLDKVKDMVTRLLGLLQEEEEEEGEGGDGDGNQTLPNPDDKEKEEMSAKLQEQVTGLETRLKAQEEENRKLKLEARERHFCELAASYPHIEDRAAFGKEMASLELSAPKQVDAVLQVHQSAADAGKQSDMFRKVGLSFRPNPGGADIEPTALESRLAEQAGISLETLRKGKAILAGKPLPDNGNKA